MLRCGARCVALASLLTDTKNAARTAAQCECALAACYARQQQWPRVLSHAGAALRVLDAAPARRNYSNSKRTIGNSDADSGCDEVTEDGLLLASTVPPHMRRDVTALEALHEIFVASLEAPHVVAPVGDMQAATGGGSPLHDSPAGAGVGGADDDADNSGMGRARRGQLLLGASPATFMDRLAARGHYDTPLPEAWQETLEPALRAHAAAREDAAQRKVAGSDSHGDGHDDKYSRDGTGSRTPASATLHAQQGLAGHGLAGAGTGFSASSGATAAGSVSQHGVSAMAAGAALAWPVAPVTWPDVIRVVRQARGFGMLNDAANTCLPPECGAAALRLFHAVDKCVPR